MHTDPPTLDRRRSRAASVSVVGAGALALLKLAAASVTGSLAIWASFVDSVLDMFASGSNLLAIRHAEVPPDDDHRWGHGKAESLSGLAQTLLVLGSAGALAYKSVERLIEPAPMAYVGWGVAVMAVSAMASVGITAYLRQAGKRYGSVALEGDAVHYLADVLTNVATIAGLLAWHFFALTWVDPVVSLAMALVLVHSAKSIGLSALDQLMDRELPEEDRHRIIKAAMGVSPHVLGIHELRSRRSGSWVDVNVHVDIRADLSFVEAHTVSAQVEEAIRTLFHQGIVTVHADPATWDPSPALDDCHHVAAPMSPPSDF